MRLELGLQSTGRVKADKCTKYIWLAPSYSIAWEITNVNVDLLGANTNNLLAKRL